MSEQAETFLDASSGMTLIDAPVTASDAAGERVAQVLSKSPGKRALRVSVEGGGCSGFSYKFDLTERDPNPDDQIIERAGGTLSDVFGALDADPSRLPDEWRAMPPTRRRIADYIAGMTDTYATEAHGRLTGV